MNQEKIMNTEDSGVENVLTEFIKLPPTQTQIKNRRFAHLQILRSEGFFNEQDVMLRYPHLYHEYLGEFKTVCESSIGSMSQFLQSQLISSQYRRTVEERGESEAASFEQKFTQIPQQNLRFQEEALLNHLQLMFLKGELPGINYDLIDYNEKLDDHKSIEQDIEDQYFDSEQPQQENDPHSNTGIQDF